MKGAIFLFFFLLAVKALYSALRSQKPAKISEIPQVPSVRIFESFGRLISHSRQAYFVRIRRQNGQNTPLFIIRKSYVALKSQANALTFVLLSGLIISQSLIIAYNFTNSSLKFGDWNTSFGSPTGFAVADLNSSSAQPEGAPDALPGAESVAPSEAVPIAQDNSQPHAPDSGGASENASSEILPSFPETFVAPANDTLPPQDASVEIVSNLTEIIPANNSEGGVSNGTDANVTGESPVIPPPENITLVSENNSVVANASEPAPIVLPPQNEASDNISAANVSGNITTPPGSPALSLIVNIPSDIRRGEAFSLNVQAANTGSADAANVVLALELPPGISGESTKAVGTIIAGSSADAAFTLTSSLNTALGLNQIRVRATYE